jgi:ribosome biogenesis protein Tsr3
MCQPIASSADDEEEKNPLKGLQLRMWDFAQCDPKRCTGARLERRGVFRAMPLKQPFKGIVLSPNGTVSVSPADRPILQEMVRRKNIDIQLCMARNVLILSLLQIYESIIGP